MSGTGIAYAHQAAVILLGLWLTPFLLARVGQRELGLWLVAGQVLGYLGADAILASSQSCRAKWRSRRASPMRPEPTV